MGAGGCGMGAGGGHGIMRRIRHLPGLTEKQHEQIDQIELQQRKLMRPNRDKMVELRDELHALIKDGAEDGKIAAKVEQLSAIRTEAAKKHALAMRDVVELLTEEQREELFSQPLGRGKHCGGKGRHR
jgi:Spy/CpxP family protein refolding chaperone